MSPEYFELYRQALEVAIELGLSIGIYDDYNWITGHCGGRTVAENNAYRESHTFWVEVPLHAGSPLFEPEISGVSNLLTEGHKEALTWLYEDAVVAWGNWQILSAFTYQRTKEISSNSVQGVKDHLEFVKTGPLGCSLRPKVLLDQEATHLLIFVTAQCETSRLIDYLNPEATEAFAIDPQAINGIGLSGQMHSSVFLDDQYKVIRPAILWNDGRTSAQCQYIKETVDLQMLFSEVCNPVLEGFTLPKLLWLRDNEPENYRKLRWLVLPKDYVRYRLTGNLHMEVSDAAGMLMMNVRSRSWSEPVLRSLGLSSEILPPIIESAEIAGEISFEAARLTGLKVGTPVVGGGADNACGAVGSGVVTPGSGMVSLGTSGVLLAHLGEPKLITHGTVHMFNSCLPHEFYMMGVMLSAGLSLSWFKNQFGRDGETYESLTAKAIDVPAGSRGLLFLPYLSGERTPHGDANARGSFVGLSATHGQGELTRAVLEGVAFGLCDSLELLRLAGWNGKALRALGGGARSILWKEIIASATGLVLEEINIDEGPALGAAILAGVGAGTYNSIIEAAHAITKVEKTVEPKAEWQKVYAELYEVYKGLYPALKDSFAHLVKFASIPPIGSANPTDL